MPNVERIYVQLNGWDWRLRQCFSTIVLEMQEQKTVRTVRTLLGNQRVKLHYRLQRKTLRGTVLDDSEVPIC